MASQKPLDDRPFKFEIDPMIGVNTPDSLPDIVQRMIYRQMEKDKTQTLYERYIKAFKIAITTLKNVNQIRVKDGQVERTELGDRKEAQARSKPDYVLVNLDFRRKMGAIAAELARQAAEQQKAK